LASSGASFAQAMTRTHEKLKNEAIQAIDKLCDDPSVTPEEAVESLEELSLYLHVVIHSVPNHPPTPQFA
jgi:hypothetical protein